MGDFDLDSVLKQIMGSDNATATDPVVELQSASPVVPVPKLPAMTAPADSNNDVTEDGELQPTPAMVAFPTFTDEDIAVTMDIRNYATLCRLKVRKWIGRKRDRSGAKLIESDKGSTSGAYSAYKKLFAGTEDKLKAVNSVLDAARTRHYQMTLPWSTTGMDDSGRRDGPRILPNTLFMEYISEMGSSKHAMKTALDDLRAAYPACLLQAQQNLGSGFVITDYPTPDQLEDLFALDFEFSPIPAGMDFKGLPQQQATRLAETLNKATAKRMENAMRDVWIRARGVVEKMVERLSDATNMFHDTLVTNVRTTTELLQHLNAVNNPAIEAIRQRMEADLCRFDPEVLRKDLSKRALVAQCARDILEEMDKASA